MINTSVFQNKKAAYFTLGCKLNFSETSTFGKMLADLGVRIAGEGDVADICLVNTCSVTEVADHKCRQAIHRLVRNNPGAFVVVTGCYAQLESESVSKIEGVDLVLGSDEKANLIQFLSDAWTAKESAAELNEGGKVESLHEYHSVKTKMIKSFAPSCSRGNRTRYFLKVQDGCDYYCTYCTIPYARGNSRNPTIASLVAQAEEAAREGGKEIVLTGVNIRLLVCLRCITFFGCDKAAGNLHTIRAEIQRMRNIFLIKYPAGHNDRNIFLIPLFVFLFAVDNLPDLSVKINGIHMCQLFMGKSQMPAGLWSLHYNKVRRAVIAVRPHLQYQLGCTLRGYNRSNLCPAGFADKLRQIHGKPGSTDNHICPCRNCCPDMLFVML